MFINYFTLHFLSLKHFLVHFFLVIYLFCFRRACSSAFGSWDTTKPFKKNSDAITAILHGPKAQCSLGRNRIATNTKLAGIGTHTWDFHRKRPLNHEKPHQEISFITRRHLTKRPNNFLGQLTQICTHNGVFFFYFYSNRNNWRREEEKGRVLCFILRYLSACLNISVQEWVSTTAESLLE